MNNTLVIKLIEFLLKDQNGAQSPDACGLDHPYEVGEAYLIRTVTHYYTGRLKAVYKNELVLEECAWIADTGRFSDALKTGELNEVEPCPGPVVVGRGGLIDAQVWSNELPMKQK